MARDTREDFWQSQRDAERMTGYNPLRSSFMKVR